MKRVNWKEILDIDQSMINDIRIVGFLYIKQGKYTIAISFFKMLAILNINEYDFQTLGALYLEKGQYLEALKFIDKALKLNPINYNNLLNKCKALICLGYKKQAHTYLINLSTNNNPVIETQAKTLLLSFF